jgi:hypothetical protein
MISSTPPTHNTPLAFGRFVARPGVYAEPLKELEGLNRVCAPSLKKDIEGLLGGKHQAWYDIDLKTLQPALNLSKIPDSDPYTKEEEEQIKYFVKGKGGIEFNA